MYLERIVFSKNFNTCPLQTVFNADWTVVHIQGGGNYFNLHLRFIPFWRLDEHHDIKPHYLMDLPILDRPSVTYQNQQKNLCYQVYVRYCDFSPFCPSRVHPK